MALDDGSAPCPGLCERASLSQRETSDETIPLCLPSGGNSPSKGRSSELLVPRGEFVPCVSIRAEDSLASDYASLLARPSSR